ARSTAATCAWLGATNCGQIWTKATIALVTAPLRNVSRNRAFERKNLIPLAPPSCNSPLVEQRFAGSNPLPGLAAVDAACHFGHFVTMA
ncbi:MAG: hypothetical protein J0H36_04470, partial [Hyphomicrobium denitrificans]|nr:hypothetical protein [Hyphomicrobium denitrificans]